MDREDRLADIVADWRERRDRGEPVEIEDLVRIYPDLAEDLRDAAEAQDLAEAAMLMPELLRKPRPAKVGPYRILEELGAGGMGTVYLAEAGEGAEDIAKGDRVALKVVHPQLLGRAGFIERFRREAEIGRRIRHENVVRTLGADAAGAGPDACHFLVMEYVEGRTLAELVRDLGRVPEALVREIALQLASGLRAIHRAEVVHRDLKPENAIITDDHRVRIMDLGVARPAEETLRLTREGQFAGSLHYAAPEQFRGTEVGPAADLYALGVLLYELATGTNPFRRDEPAETVDAQLAYVPPRAADASPEVSAFLSEVLATLLAKEPSDRFDGADELLDVLRRGEDSAWWAGRKSDLDRGIRRMPRVPVRRETRLHGREEDLALLQAAFRRAERGEGNCLLLEGEAGIGKSRLVDAFLSGLEGRHAQVLYGSYPPSGGRGGISDAILGHFGTTALSLALSPYLTATPTLVPGFAALLMHAAAPADATSLSGEALRTVFGHLMRGLAAEKPLVFVVEDLHFADPDSRSILLSLARALEGHRVLLLLTSRPGIPAEEVAWFSRLPVFRRTSLSRLSAREVILLLEDAFRSRALAEKLGGKIARKSDGVPFFVFEMIRGLREGRFITELPDGSFIESKVIEEIEVPSAVRDLIGARLAGLSREDRVLLDVGAVHGFEFDPDLVARTLSRPRVEVLQALAHVERRSGVVRSFGAEYRFDHHQIQEVVYDDLPPALRQEYHRLAAEAFTEREGHGQAEATALPGEASLYLAHHYLLGASPLQASPHLDPAIRHLKRTYRHEAVVELADRVIRSPRPAGRRDLVRATLAKGSSLRLLARHPAALDAATEAARWADELGDPALRMVAHRELGICNWRLSRWEQARQESETSLAIARELGDLEGEAAATSNLGMVFDREDRLEEARTHYERGLALARACGNRELETRITRNLGSLVSKTGPTEESLAHFERYLELSLELGDRQGEALALGSIASAYTYLGRPDEALDLFDRSRALCREIGDRRNEEFFSVNRAELMRTLGRLASALSGHQRWLAFTRETGERWREAEALLLIGEMKIELGDLPGAEQDILAGREAFREIGAPHMEVEVLKSLGEIAAARADPAAAVEAIERALGIAREAGEAWKVPRILLALGRMRALAGETDAARAALAEARELSEELGDTGNSVVCAAHQTILDGDAAPALEAFERWGGDMDHGERTEVEFLLWRATGDLPHLEDAHRLLCHLRDHAPEEYRETMLANVPLHRDIMAAWAEASRAG